MALFWLLFVLCVSFLDNVLVAESLEPFPTPFRRYVSRRAFWGSSTAALLLFPEKARAVSRTVRVTVQSERDRIGLELYDVSIGNPPRPVVAIRNVLIKNDLLQPGMILRDYPNASLVQQKIRSGPYPLELVFENLAAAGDAISDLGTPIVSAQDALKVAQQQAASSSTSTSEYIISVTQSPAKDCTTKSRRGDILEINYEARIENGAVYDSSVSRGTGLPYQFVLGSGDMLPGVDQGLYDMCPGEARTIRIPPPLAYGSRGNKLYRIPPNSSLVWHVELVAVNAVRHDDDP